MTVVAIVIKDPKVAREQEIARNLEANLRVLDLMNLPDIDKNIRANAVKARVEKNVGPEKQVGDLHTVAKVECPDGGKNCRNCGDPNFAESCKQAGHCSYCGTRHGVAPDSIVAANGYELITLDDMPKKGQIWDRQLKRFIDVG